MEQILGQDPNMCGQVLVLDWTSGMGEGGKFSELSSKNIIK
jgi:hypothetical protein